MTYIELDPIIIVSNSIINQTLNNSKHVIYHIQKAEKLLRPNQLQLLKDMVVTSLLNLKAIT